MESQDLLWELAARVFPKDLASLSYSRMIDRRKEGRVSSLHPEVLLGDAGRS